MSTRIGRYTSTSSMGKGQCIVETDGYFEVGTTEEGTVDGIISEVGEVLNNGLIQVDLKGHHEAVAYENCWVDKHGYIFSRADEAIPMIPLEPTLPDEPELPPVVDPDLPVLPEIIPVNPYIDLWKADRYTITLDVAGTGVVLASSTKDWLTVTYEGVKFDNIFLRCNPLRIVIDKHDLKTTLIVNGYKVAEIGKAISIDRIGLSRFREPFSGFIRNVELIDLLDSTNDRFYSMEPTKVEVIPDYSHPTEEIIEVVEEVIKEEPVPTPVYILPDEPVLVTNLQFVTSGRTPWVQINKISCD